MKDLGEPKKLLKTQIKYNINRIFIHIYDYISAICNRYAPTVTITGNIWTPMAVISCLFKAMCPVYKAEI